MSNGEGKRRQNADLAEGHRDVLNNYTFDPLTAV